MEFFDILRGVMLRFCQLLSRSTKCLRANTDVGVGFFPHPLVRIGFAAGTVSLWLVICDWCNPLWGNMVSRYAL